MVVMCVIMVASVPMWVIVKGWEEELVGVNGGDGVLVDGRDGEEEVGDSGWGVGGVLGRWVFCDVLSSSTSLLSGSFTLVWDTEIHSSISSSSSYSSSSSSYSSSSSSASASSWTKVCTTPWMRE